MISAILIENDVVTNIIYIDAENMAAFIAGGMELINPADLEFDLELDDYREDGVWYRDVEGVKTALPLPVPEPVVDEYQQYYEAVSGELGGAE